MNLRRVLNLLVSFSLLFQSSLLSLSLSLSDIDTRSGPVAAAVGVRGSATSTATPLAPPPITWAARRSRPIAAADGMPSNAIAKHPVAKRSGQTVGREALHEWHHAHAATIHGANQ